MAAIDPASVVAVAQVARIAVEAFVQHQKGELTQEELDLAWEEIHGHAITARGRWEQSKLTPAAAARRDDETGS